MLSWGVDCDHYERTLKRQREIQIERRLSSRIDKVFTYHANQMILFQRYPDKRFKKRRGKLSKIGCELLHYRGNEKSRYCTSEI